MLIVVLRKSKNKFITQFSIQLRAYVTVQYKLFDCDCEVCGYRRVIDYSEDDVELAPEA